MDLELNNNEGAREEIRGKRMGPELDQNILCVLWNSQKLKCLFNSVLSLFPFKKLKHP